MITVGGIVAAVVILSILAVAVVDAIDGIRRRRRQAAAVCGSRYGVNRNRSRRHRTYMDTSSTGAVYGTGWDAHDGGSDGGGGGE